MCEGDVYAQPGHIGNRMSPNYYKLRRLKLLERSRKGVAARERI